MLYQLRLRKDCGLVPPGVLLPSTRCATKALACLGLMTQVMREGLVVEGGGAVVGGCGAAARR